MGVKKTSLNSIEKHLVLHKYMLSLFGVDKTKDLLDILKKAREGVADDNQTHFCNVLKSSKGVKIENLEEYDKNVIEYIYKIKQKRGDFELKYFQYLAVLFTEIYLDKLKNNKEKFLVELNEFIDSKKIQIKKYEESDLRKLAYWMATGSGKTLLMHINYYQFLRYLPISGLRNIILITPNEGLSKQHEEELIKSGIPCGRHSDEVPELGIRIIEITKLVTEKKGGGLSIDVRAFEGPNLIFVDEGHKGLSSESRTENAWANIRQALSSDGFVFEYSATFGQILNRKGNNNKNKKGNNKKLIDENSKSILDEYSKSILFDYSYKYFYEDGYGKDFYVANLSGGRFSSNGQGSASNEAEDEFLVASLLKFYEQLRAFEENQNKESIKRHNIEKPLWVLAGATVKDSQKGNKENKETTDVVRVIEFLNRVLSNKEWFKGKVEEIIGNREHNSIFVPEYIIVNSVDELVEDIYNKVFHGKGKLRIVDIRDASGELGLKAGEGEYFGVVNVGSSEGLKKLLEDKKYNIEIDAISSSLFDKIKEENSDINILIGSRKFAEGWDSWRVSTMTLLNLGQSPGPLIIQLFGRGVRLKGENMSLKRTQSDDKALKILQTLYVYGIRADYIGKFLEAIKREGLDYEEIIIPTQIFDSKKEEWEKLHILDRRPGNRRYFSLSKEELGDEIYYIDLTSEVRVIRAFEEIRDKESQEAISLKDKLKLIDIEKVLKVLYEYKAIKGYWDLRFDKDSIEYILSKGGIKCDRSFSKDVENINNAAVLLTKRFIDRFYRRKAQEALLEETACTTLGKYGVEKFFTKEYNIKLPSQLDENKLKRIKTIAKDIEDASKEGNMNKLKEQIGHLRGYLCVRWIDFSFFAPILCKSSDDIIISPDAFTLVESERDFIDSLSKYLANKPANLNGVNVYLARNPAMSGVGFKLESAGFYPDFILWLHKQDEQGRNRQWIVFIDPKGILMLDKKGAEKLNFRKYIKNLQSKIQCNGNTDIILDGFIVTNTPYAEFHNRTVASREKLDGVIFMEEENWCESLFNFILQG
ncbi:MAG: DEAD/DEAH box helicase family protein [Candidatus Kryptonium sp.]